MQSDVEEADEDSKYSFDHLVLREHILLIKEIDNFRSLEFKLEFLFKQLFAHFTIKKAKNTMLQAQQLKNGEKLEPVQKGCRKCILREVLCFECNEGNNYGKNDIGTMQQCPRCQKYFHKHFRPKFSDKAKQRELEIEKPHMSKSCISRHLCIGLLINYFERD